MTARMTMAVPLLLLASTLASPGTVVAQGFTPPGGGQTVPAPPLSMPPLSMPPLSMPQPDRIPPAPGQMSQRPGFPSQPGQPPLSPQPGQTRQNYADELTDFGVPPQTQLQDNVGSPTPTTIPGAHVITTAEMRQAVGSNILFFDVLASPPHPSLPGAILLPGAGDGGSFDDPLQQKLWTVLSQATKMNPSQPIVFLCAGSRCWESYNAALRAVQMGFKTVLWYRGGLAAWQAAGLKMGTHDGGGAAPRPQRPGFGNNQG